MSLDVPENLPNTGDSCRLLESSSLRSTICRKAYLPRSFDLYREGPGGSFEGGPSRGVCNPGLLVPSRLVVENCREPPKRSVRNESLLPRERPAHGRADLVGEPVAPAPRPKSLESPTRKALRFRGGPFCLSSCGSVPSQGGRTRAGASKRGPGPSDPPGSGPAPGARRPSTPAAASPDQSPPGCPSRFEPCDGGSCRPRGRWPPRPAGSGGARSTACRSVCAPDRRRRRRPKSRACAGSP